MLGVNDGDSDGDGDGDGNGVVTGLLLDFGGSGFCVVGLVDFWTTVDTRVELRPSWQTLLMQEMMIV